MRDPNIIRMFAFQMKDKIIELFNKGKSYKEICTIIGCSKSTVSYHLKNLRNFEIKELENREILNCNYCGIELIKKKSKVRETNFCSNSHKSKYHNPLNREKLIQSGIKSSQLQNNRSKNEIYFAELCKEIFNDVTTNEPIFNGWDSDVIIHDLKVAVLWNGKWHYEKITKEHSVKQVQNRDYIKIKEIENKGYLPYIIKDMGKYNKKFVEKQFASFLKLNIVGWTGEGTSSAS